MERKWFILVLALSASTEKKDYFRFCLARQYDHQLASSWIRKFKKKGLQCIGRGRKGLSTKIHLGLSPGFVHGACLSEGKRMDMKVFSKLWSVGDWGDVLYVIADEGYDFYEARKCLREAGKKPVIPRRKGAICPSVQDKERYQTHSNIERFFGKIKKNKRLALRFDKLDVTFFSFFAIACLKGLNLLC